MTATICHAFRLAGFEIGPPVSNNFSITAPAAVFEKYFGIQLPHSAPFPLDALPVNIRAHVEAVVFAAAPDFGPWGGY